MKKRDEIIEEMRLTLAAYGRGEISASTANALVAILSQALDEVES